MKTVIFVALFTVVVCKTPETWSWMDQEQTVDRKYCCTPPKWEGLQAGIGGLVVSGRPQTFSIVSRISFDRTGMRLYSFSNTTNNGNVNSVKTIQDFKSGYQWVIDVRSQQCKKTKLTQKFNDGCIPDDARYNGNYAIGLGSESFMAQSFTFNVKTPGSELGAALTVTAQQCVPVGEILVGSTNNIPMMLDLGFVNVTGGIKDPSIFNPPAICKHTNNSDIFAPHMEALQQILHF